MVDFHEEVGNEKQARELLDMCVKEIEARTHLKISNKPSIKIVEVIEFDPSWFSAYIPKDNVIILKQGAECTNIIHELIHANTDLSGTYDFTENLANYFTFLVAESLHRADRPSQERNIRDFLRGIGIIEKIRGLIGEQLFGLLVVDFYKGVNEILKRTVGEELSQSEIDVLRSMMNWCYWRHYTLEFFKFTPEKIASYLGAEEQEVEAALEKLKKIGLVEFLNSGDDSVLMERLYELCEQLAEAKKPMAFFYR